VFANYAKKSGLTNGIQLNFRFDSLEDGHVEQTGGLKEIS
jgi:hypothetical protein